MLQLHVKMDVVKQHQREKLRIKGNKEEEIEKGTKRYQPLQSQNQHRYTALKP